MTLEEYIFTIANDLNKGYGTRIDEIMQLRKSITPVDEAERLRNDEIIFSSLIDMIKAEEDSKHFDDESLLQLLTLLAETYVKQRSYQKLKRIADEVLNIMRDEITPWKAYEETIPRIIDAIEYSVYNHALYEILCRFIKEALKEQVDMTEYVEEAEKLMRLRILLEDMRESYLFNNEIKETVARLLDSSQLMEIIDRPDLGHLRKDPIEYTRFWEEIIYDVEEKLDRRFANHPRGMGFCFKYWNAKRELLKDEYDIEWRSPSQMNPRVMFD